MAGNRTHGRVEVFHDQADYAALAELLALAARNALLDAQAWRWAWSSAATHCGEADRTGLVDGASGPQGASFLMGKLVALALDRRVSVRKNDAAMVTARISDVAGGEETGR